MQRPVTSSRIALSILIAVAGALLAVPCQAQTQVPRSQLLQQFSLTDVGISPGDNFSSAIAMDGTTAVVGASGDSAQGNSSAGSAYVFEQNGSTWTSETKLRASDAATSQNFGGSVAISGDTVAVSARPTYTGSGAVYVFTRGGGAWPQQAKIDPSMIPAGILLNGSGFPTTVALSKDTLVVGVSGNYSYQGQVFVFVRTGTAWQYQASLATSPSINNAGYGNAVAVTGDTVVVGAPSMYASGYYNAGMAFVFTRSGSTWTQQATLQAGDAASYVNFGSSLAIEADTLLVGAPGLGGYQGGGYIFTRSGTTWSQTAELTQAGYGTYYSGPYAGQKVALSGSTAILGFRSPYSNTYYGTQQMAATFTRTGSTWSFQSDLAATANSAGYYSYLYSGGLALSGSSLLAGKLYIYSSTAANELIAYQNSGSGWSGAVPVAVPVSTYVQLGSSVTVKGGMALVGAPGDRDANGNATGSVRVLKSAAGGWSIDQTLTPLDGVASGRFGAVVVRDGDVAVVGCGSEAAYVFQQSNGTWSQMAKLTASDGMTGDGFGLSVAVLQNTILVGAPSKNNGIGQVYVFTNGETGWTEVAQLAPVTDVLANARFGTDVELTQNMAVVSAPGLSAVYVFEGGGAFWLRTQILQPVGNYSSFGSSVAISGDTMLVAGNVTDPVTNIQSVGAFGYQWKAGRWQGGSLWMSVPGGSSSSVAMDGNVAMVSDITSYYNNNPSMNTYLFARRNGAWTNIDEFQGNACAISGSTFLIGNTNADVSVPKSGVATIYAPAAFIGISNGATPGSPELSLAQPAIDLGAVVIGNSYRYSLTIHNDGLLPLTDLQISVNGTDEPSFIFAPLGVTSIAPGASAVLNFNFVPWSTSPSVAIGIHSNDPNYSNVWVQVAAEVTATGLAPGFSQDVGTGFALNDPASPVTAVVFSIIAAGSLPLSIQWKRNGQPIAGATGTSLSLGAPSTRLVGDYTAELTNPYGHATSQHARLFWLKPTPPVKNLILNEGDTLTLQAPVIGTVTAGWQVNPYPYGSQFLIDDGRITGSATARLQIPRLTSADSGTYVFTFDNGSSINIAQVTVRSKPVLDLGAMPPSSTFNWRVSTSVFGGPFFIGDNTTRFAATGLPAGVTLDPVSGILGGQPGIAGNYTAQISAANADGATPNVALNLIVAPLDPNLVGSHVGLIKPDPEINGSLGGTVTIEVSNTGAVTGWTTLGAQVYRFTGHLGSNPDTSSPDLYCNVTLATFKNGKTLSLVFAGSNVVTGHVMLANAASTHGMAFATLRQQPWALLVPTYAGTYNAVLAPDGQSNPPLPAPPGGSGYLQIQASAKGFTFSGRVSDGTVVTGSSPVLQDVNGQFPIPAHQLLYHATGSLHGWMTLHSDRTVDGTLGWWKDPSVHRTGASWPNGFAQTDLAVIGEQFLPPGPGEAISGLASGTVAFDHAALPALAADTDFTFILNTASQPSLISAPRVNPTLSISRTTGLVKGSITLLTRTPSPSRQVPFYGVLAGNLGQSAGEGFFLAPPPSSPNGNGPAVMTSGQLSVNP